MKQPRSLPPPNRPIIATLSTMGRVPHPEELLSEDYLEETDLSEFLWGRLKRPVQDNLK